MANKSQSINENLKNTNATGLWQSIGEDSAL